MQKHEAVLKTVKPVDQRVLPDAHDLAHAVAFYFCDELARLVVDLHNVNALSVSVTLEPAERAEFETLEGETLWNWLRDTGRQTIIDDLTYRQLTAAVLSDAAHFICESLLASGKGKMTVALALLRKPLKENLLLLEWLCANPAEFLEHFQGESISSYVLNRMSKNHRLEIMRTAASMVELAGIDDELLWLTRYGKEYERSLETLWTKATHLVTTVQASATEPGNLNFVFSSESDIAEQWNHYYFIVPFLLFYFVQVAETVASRFVEWKRQARPFQVLRRQLAFMRYVDETAAARDLGWSAGDFYVELARLFTCLSCDNKLDAGEMDIDRFWLVGEVTCPICGESSNLWEILPDDDSDAPGELDEEHD